MKSPVAEQGLSLDLLDVLERDFRDWLDAGPGSPNGPHSDAHERLWKRAVFEPAKVMLARPGKLFRARLVNTAHALAGGRADGLPRELPLAVEILHLGSLIVDDVQDSSRVRRGQPTLHELVGAPLAINTGNLFYCWTLDLMSRVGLPVEREAQLLRRTANAMLRCHQGQALDLTVRVYEIAPYDLPALVQAATSLKSGTLMELAAAVGAVAAGADAEGVETLCEFGSSLGVALQMLDDLSGVLNDRRRDKGVEDLRLARPTWAWSWLARDLDSATFYGLQEHSRAVAAGADPEGLLRSMRRHLRPHSAERVHVHLHGSLENLARRTGPSAELTAMRQEIERLERSYV